jgi:hypothetical protein
VTGDANFSMNVTSLTVGGFNQPAVARSLIELTGKAESGFSQRFLWLFPKPVYGKFHTYTNIDDDFIEKIVDLLGGQWRRALPGRGMEVTDYIFPTELHQLRSFIEKHDRVTDQLEILAAKDDFLTGVLSKSMGQILRRGRQFFTFCSTWTRKPALTIWMLLFHKTPSQLPHTLLKFVDNM